MFTKGEMVKDLKNWGVRRGVKADGSDVCVKQLRTHEISKLWDEYKAEHPEAKSCMDN